jgi:hypothetical protein
MGWSLANTIRGAAGYQRVRPPVQSAGFRRVYPRPRPRDDGYRRVRPRPSGRWKIISASTGVRSPSATPNYAGRLGSIQGVPDMSSVDAFLARALQPQPQAVPDMGGVDSHIAQLLQSLQPQHVQGVPDTGGLDQYLMNLLAASAAKRRSRYME